MNPGVAEPTFRDPAGSLVVEPDRAVRTIRPAFREAVFEFLNSNFYCRAVERGEMIASEVEEDAEGLRLIHPRVRIATYPWEWTASQWLAASELTLQLCDEALDDGWILKDATPLNVLFNGARPVLVDVLSFERRDPGSSLWLAYGQYVRTFLLPLLKKSSKSASYSSCPEREPPMDRTLAMAPSSSSKRSMRERCRRLTTGQVSMGCRSNPCSSMKQAALKSNSRNTGGSWSAIRSTW